MKNLKISLFFLAFMMILPTVFGMFTQPDTQVQNNYNPADLNRYAFEKNNPIKNVDPDGHRVENVVEPVGHDSIIAVYENQNYVGRIVDEAAATTTYPTQWGTSMDVTTYDYLVQPGSKGNARGTLTQQSYDISGAPLIPLSEIVKRDKKNPLRDENFEIAGGLAEDSVSALSLGSSRGIIRGLPSAVRSLDTALNYKTGAETLATGNWKNIVSFVPGGSTYLAVSTNKGYQSYQKVPTYGKTGWVTYQSLTSRSSVSYFGSAIPQSLSSSKNTGK